MMELQSNILEKLHCSKCNEYLSYAPIMITEDGENLCGRCITDHSGNSNKKLIRNKAYEDVAAITAFPCRYKESGCDVVAPWDDVISHEDHCEYRLYKCPVASTGVCEWEGHSGTLMDHYKETHPELVLEHPSCLDTDIVVDNDKNMLLSFLGFVFLVQIRCNTGLSKLWHCVHCLAQPKLARQFSFCLQFTSDESSFKTEKPVLSEKCLTMRIDKSIETNVNHLLGMLGDYENIKVVLSILPKVDSDLQNLFLCPKCKDSKLPAVFKSNNVYYCANCKAESSFNDRNMKYLYDKLLKICKNNYASCTFINNTKLVCRHEIWECKYQKKCLFNCVLGFNELENHFVNKTHTSIIERWLNIDIWHYGQTKIDGNIILYKILMKNSCVEIYIYTQLPVEDIHLYKCMFQFENGGKLLLNYTPTAEHDWGICQILESNPYLYSKTDKTFYICDIIISKYQ